MTRRRRRAALLVAGGLAVAACSSSSHSKAPTPTTTAAAGAHVLLVGSYRGHAGGYQTIQAAVDAARPGDWVLIGPGDYHEQYDHTAPVGPAASAGVYITTPGLHLRGMDRNRVVVDGTKPGSPPCSAAAADQDPGPLNGAGKPAGRNGIEVWKADGTSVDNLTACNFVTGADGGGNEIWWNGGDGSGTVGMGAYNGSYLNATSTYAAGATTGSYGIFVSNAGGPGLIAHSYASNMSDAGFYIGACADCNVTLDDAHAQYSSLGYSGTNSGGHLVVKNSEFDHNKTGFTTNSQNNDDAPSPQDGACPGNGIGPTGTHSCWVFEDNYVHDNNNPNVPSEGSANLGWPGGGLVIAGGRNDTVVDNRFVDNASWAVSVVPYPDTGTPPPVAHCVGGDPNGYPALGIKGCYYAAWGNEIANNTFSGNGSYGNPTNRGPGRPQRQPRPRQLLARQHRSGGDHEHSRQPAADQRDLRRAGRGGRNHEPAVGAVALRVRAPRPVPAQARDELPAADGGGPARAGAPDDHAQPVRRRPRQPVVRHRQAGGLVAVAARPARRGRVPDRPVTPAPHVPGRPSALGLQSLRCRRRCSCIHSRAGGSPATPAP